MRNDQRSSTRRGVLTAASGALAGGLAGCAGQMGGAGASTSQFDDSDPLVAHERFGKGSETLDYWTSTFYTPIESESDQPAAAPALKTQHEEWAEAHPDHRIQVSYPAFGQWKDDLLTRANQGDAPDGSTLNHPWVPDFYNYLQPLNDYVEDVDDFFPFVRETAMRDGDLLAAWKYTDCRCLYYRQDLIDEYGDGSPPRTWDEVLQVGGDIAENEDMAGYLTLSGTLVNLPYFWGQGGELVDDQGRPVLEASDNRTAMVRTLRFLRRLVDEGVAPQRTANVTEYEALAREARNGQVAMFVGGNWQIEKDFKNQVDGDRWQRWNVAEIPMRRSDQFATGVGGWTEGSFAEGDSGGAAAMKEFIAKFVEPESMGRYCEAAGLLPTRDSVFENPDLFGPNTFPYQDRFRSFLQNGKAQPAFPIYSTISTEFENAIQTVITGQADPEAAVETMISNVDQAYDG